MRASALAALLLLISIAAVAQNTDIEALSGLQFNFGNPGARSLGMGGAFIGLADDASAAESNPAGLTILRKSEVSIEMRSTTTSQRVVTGGTYPFVTSIDSAARLTSISFASVVLPTDRAVLAFYYHRPLAFRSSIDVTSRYATPVFFLGPGGPLSREECAGEPLCAQHQIYPFRTSVDLSMQTFGVSLARQWRTFSAGVSARYQRFDESALTLRTDLDLPGQPTFAVEQTNGARVFGSGSDSDLTFVAGVKWSPAKPLSMGAVYKQGASFPAPVSAGMGSATTIVGVTQFHVPSSLGAGISYRPAGNVTINADAVRLKYSHLTDNFLSVIEYGTEDGSVERLSGYHSADGTELHAGIEYYVLSRVPVAIRGGWSRDPAHAIHYDAPLLTAHDVAAQILFPQRSAESHYSVGAGIALPRFQIDAAYDQSRSVRTASISMMARY